MNVQRILVFLFLCFTGHSFSQISQSVSVISDCVPFNVTYVAPAGTSGTWDFGNGNPSNLPSGGFIYNTPGTYTITYTGIVVATNAPITFSLVANVYAKPTANFSIQQTTNNCVVKTVTTTNLSTGQGLNSWVWNYGDGGSLNSSTGGLNTYGYTIPGTYSISLTVANTTLSNSGNCVSTATTIGTVSVFASPVAIISSNPINLSSCTAPFAVNFSAANSVGVNATYAWNFGNGQTSTAMTPTVVNYTTQNNYNVSLTVTANGCTSISNSVVVVNTTTLAATVPQTVCINAPFTATVASNQTAAFWNVGGITVGVPTTTNATPQLINAVFTNSGVATLTVTAGSGNCQSVLTRTVFVEQVIANFTLTPPAYSCSSPYVITLQNLTTANATQFTFSVPAFQQSTVMPPPASNTLTYQFSGVNPSFTIPLFQGSQNPYSNFNSPYSLAYAPNITLTAISASGCRNSVTHVFDSITRPTASFYKDRMNGCAPLNVLLSSNSYTFAHDPITSYTWCNGATPPVFVTGTGPALTPQNFVYNTAGTYSPYLIIQTAGGCADISFTEAVIVANPPVISFNFSPSVVCPNEPVQIINTTAPGYSNTINHWHVASDNGYFSGCINDPNPAWKFTNVGVHSLTMSAYVDGCRTDYVSPNQVTVNGPIVTAQFETNCVNRRDVTFYSKLQSATSATLDFGDGSPTHTITNGGGLVNDVVSHTYPSAINYTAILTGANPGTGCPLSIDTMIVTVRDVQAVLSSASTVCMNVATDFTASASTDVFVSCSRGYIWYKDNEPPLETASPVFSPSFATAGVHHVRLMVKDMNSCVDTVTQAIRVSSVTAAFAFASPTVCINTPIQLVNSSYSVPEDPIVSNNWVFGDNTPGSTVVSPFHTYVNAQSPSSAFIATLTVVNSLGCTAKVPHTIQVIKPSAFFLASNYNICLGPTTVTFNAQQSGGTYTSTSSGPSGSYTLTSNSAVFNHTYTLPGTHNVTMKIRDAQGCEALVNNLVINAQMTPTAGFVFQSIGATPGSNVICAGAVSFSSTSTPTNQSYNYFWNLYQGANIVNQSNVSFTYPQVPTQIYTIGLTVSSIPNNCSSTKTQTVTIYSPNANIIKDKSVICLRDLVKFNIGDTTNTGVMGWTWDYGENTGENDTTYASLAPPASTIHPYIIYPASGIAPVKLTYFSSEKKCSRIDTVFIRIIKVDADFKRNNELAAPDSIHCLRLKDVFTNTSPNSSASGFRWDFGNGDMSNLQNPQYTYPLPGVYQVTLTVSDPNTCKGISVKNMTINPLPTAQVSSNDSICQNSPFDLIGVGISSAGIVSYQWLPAAAVNSPTSGTTIATPNSSVPVVYSLSVTDGNGCVSDAVTHSVYIQPPAPQIQWDTTVIVGQQVPINAFVSSDFSYLWNPVNDLSCNTCANPLSTSTVNIVYTVDVQDNMKCFIVSNTYSVFIDPQTSVDVPTAFTPNGDGTNDVIYADGWGIKKLHYFKIYNRWGQLLFESNDIKVGWDGTFNGVPQNMETYIYQVSVETYLDKQPLQKTSSFKLIR